MLRKLSFSLFLVSLLVLSGCKISGTIAMDGNGIEGATVVLSGDATATTQTNDEGCYVFDSVKAGTYTVTMEPPAGYTRSINQRVVKESDYVNIDDVNFSMGSASIRQTESGNVIGFREDNNSHAWLGIPYAKSDRWKAPKSADSWAGDTYMALEIGPLCTQFADLLAGVPEEEFGKATGCEDCLYLNIFAPEFAPEEIPAGDNRLPVMVWIHGGGNSIGQGGTYNGQELAKEHNLIIVTFNYRLGPLGWFTHPALQTGDLLDDSGNYGTIDIIRVLTWVRDNIENFGGDPDNVTVFGESAGAHDTLTMMISPLATGLFHKGIVESGGIGTTEMSRGQNYMDDPVDPGHSYSSREAVNKLLIADGLAADRDEAKAYQDAMTNQQIQNYLLGKSNYDILDVYYGGYGGMISMPMVFRDGTILPDADPLTLLEDTANYNEVPIMIGTNRDERKLFMILDPEFVVLLSGIPIRAKDKKYYELYSSYNTDAWKATGVDEIASVLSETDGQPGVYAYRFD